MTGSVRESFLDVREWSDVLQDIREWSRGMPTFPGVVKWPYRMSGIGRETLPNVREGWEVLPNVQEASRMSRSGREPLTDVREAQPDVR